MPHTTIPPNTVEEVLATGTLDWEWVAMLRQQPVPTSEDFGDLETLKGLSKSMLPRMQATLRASRPEHLTELEITVNVPPTDLVSSPAQNRVLLCYPEITASTGKFPLVILIHGGGHCIGDPEMEVPLGRKLAEQLSAVVIMPSYRLAPEHSFPAGFNDNLELLKMLAQDSAGSSTVLPAELSGRIDTEVGIILGGTSAGSNISAGVAQYYYRWQKQRPELPVLRGLFLSSTIGVGHLPEKYRPYFLSRQQNKDNPPLDGGLFDMFGKAVSMDLNSQLWQPINQDPSWLKDEGIRVYFQAAGADVVRDGVLIYERMLREAGIETRLDLYAGFGHCFWTMGGGYSAMEMSQKRMQHSIDAVQWLLRKDCVV